jgi:hypothetical protein
MNNRPDFAKTQRDKQNQREFLCDLEAARSYIGANLKYFIDCHNASSPKSICPRIDERPLDYLQRCYVEACNDNFGEFTLHIVYDLIGLIARMEKHIDGTEELDAEKELYNTLFLDDEKTSAFLKLHPSLRALSLFAQYTPFNDEPKLLIALEKIEMRFLRQYSTERIYDLTKNETDFEPKTKETMQTLAPLATIAQSVQDVAKIMTDPYVSLTDLAPTVAYGENLLATLRDYLIKLDDDFSNSFSSVVEIRYANHDEFSRRKRRLMSAVHNLRQIVANMDGDAWLKAIKEIGLTETEELIEYLRKILMPVSDFNIDHQYNLIIKAPEILTVINAIWDRYLYWLMNDADDEPLHVFVTKTNTK